MIRLLIVLSLFMQPGTGPGSEVHIQVSNFRNNKGVCRACIFNSAAGFAENKALQCVVAAVSNRTAEAVFKSLPPGNYAVFVFHDANNNNKMDKNIFGIPSEGYGASKNNLPFAAAPTFEANRFSVTEGFNYRFNIRLRNL